MHPLPRSRSGFWRLVVGRALGTRPEEELLHLSLQKLAGLGLDRREPVLVDDHDLVLDPPGPAFARNPLESALPQRARVEHSIQPRGFPLETGAMHRSCPVILWIH